MAIAVLGVAAAMASSYNAQAAPEHGPRRDRTIVVYDDHLFWDPLWADWYFPYEYPYGYSAPYVPGYATGRAARTGLVPVELHVHPWKASVIVDGSTLGQARDYNGDLHPLWLRPGTHEVELEYPGYQTLRFKLDAEKGLPRSLHYSLNKGEGPDPRTQVADTSGGGEEQHPK